MRRRPFSRLSPPQLIALSFAAISVLGAVLLALPVTHAPGQSVTFLQALFMATSAVCVTGLAVVPTGQTFNTLGEVVLLLLLQIGGLGIVTFGTLFATLAGRRVGFGERLRLAEQAGSFDVGGVTRLIRLIVLYTLAFEAVGALILYTRFGPLEGWGSGAYYAIFYAVSAFNNGGFTLYADSLTRFRGDPVVSLTVAALVVLGGLGFLVVANLAAWRAVPRRNPLLTYTKIVLFMTAVLLPLGALGFALLEWTNPATLGGLPPLQKLLASAFEGAMPRSAGFNTLEYSLMRPATLLFTIILMFIGASPGSTGGGIKVTTFFVLVLAAWSMVRGRGEPSAFQRRIDTDTILRALVVTVLSLGLVNFGLVLLTLTNPRLPFLSLLFETVSAFGTVGLSLGATPQLSPLGQVVVILLMYLGRIGPLTFALALSMRGRRELVSYPAEKNILIG